MSITVKNEDQINKMRKAGKILKDTLDLLERSIYPGQTTSRLNDLAYNYIISQGATPSFLNYEGFPFTICASLNDQVVHGFCNNIPLKEEYLSSDVVTESSVFYDFIVPEGYFFAMGDNRTKSKDCRETGCIPFEKLEGIVRFRFWPFNEFGKID